MATRLRLARFGAKGDPFYRIVAAHSKNCRNSFIEVLGSYDPKKGMKEAKLDLERVAYWKKQGALSTDAVSQIIKSVGNK